MFRFYCAHKQTYLFFFSFLKRIAIQIPHSCLTPIATSILTPDVVGDVVAVASDTHHHELDRLDVVVVVGGIVGDVDAVHVPFPFLLILFIPQFLEPHPRIVVVWWRLDTVLNVHRIGCPDTTVDVDISVEWRCSVGTPKSLHTKPIDECHHIPPVHLTILLTLLTKVVVSVHLDLMCNLNR